MNKTYDESLRTMIQTREPPFEGNVISTFNAMDGVLAIGGETTLNKTTRMMKKAGAVKRSDGDWNLSPLRRKGYAIKDSEWQPGDIEGRGIVYVGWSNDGQVSLHTQAC